MNRRFYGYNRSDYYYARTAREAFGSNMNKPLHPEQTRLGSWLGWVVAVLLFLVLIGEHA